MSEEKDSMPVPLNDWVLVTPHVTPGVTEGGIELPDSAKKRINRGNVMAVGPGKPVDGLAMDIFFPRVTVHPHSQKPEPPTAEEILKRWPRRPMAMKEGDVVHYPDYAGHEVSSDDGNYIMVKEEDILAIE